MRYIYFFIFLLLFLPLNIQAIGVSISPAKIELIAPIGEESAAYLNVKNAGSDVNLFELYLDEFESFIKIEPSSFILESLENKKVNIKITPNETGKYVTNISVISRPLNSKEFQIGSGVKIPFKIDVEAKKEHSKLISKFILGEAGIIEIPDYIIAIFLFLFLIGYIFLLKYKIKKLDKKESDSSLKP